MPKVVTEYDIELAKWNAKIAQIRADMRNTAQSGGAYWNKASREVKDFFDPLSRGSLAKAGGLGVGLFAATSALNAFRATVDELKTAEYLTPDQRGQMEYISSFFNDIAERRQEMIAGGIAWLGDLFTGGAVSEEGRQMAAADARNRVREQQVALDAAQQARAQAQMSDAEKLADMQRRADILGRRIEKAPDEESSLKLQTDRTKLLAEMDTLRKRIEDDDAKTLASRGQRISALQRDIENNRLNMLPDDGQLAAYGDKLRKILRELAENVDPLGKSKGTLEELKKLAEAASESRVYENALALVREGQEVQMKINRLSEGRETAKTAALPGSVAAAINSIFGRSANELIVDETKRQTQVLERIDKGIQKLAEGGQNPFAEDDLFSFP